MPRFVTAWALVALAPASHALIPISYARRGPLRIRSVRLLAASRTPVYGRVEMVVDLSATYDNPFDPADVALDATILAPSGKRLRIPGFLYRPFARTLGEVTLPIAYSSTEAARSGKASLTQHDAIGERLVPAGEPSWRVRFSPSEPGRYTAVLYAKDRTGSVTSKPLDFVAVAGTNRGFVRTSTKDRRYFAFDDGSPYYPLGDNACWAGARGTRDFDAWFPAYGKAGANWSRLWLSPNWTTFALERPPIRIGQFDLANAWRLDYVLGLAEKYGLYLNLCIDSYNVLRDKINWPEWERSPQNKANGGPLAKPADFWTDPTMARLYLAKLRYLVARYGSSSHVMAWELWNEVDGTTDYAPAPVRDWHRRMARALRATDPYRHLISSSFGMFGEDREDSSYFALPDLDFSQSHLYGASDLAAATVAANERLGRLRKPHLVAELGADTTGPKPEDDPDGIQLHDPMWASIASAGSGGTMLWWWDSYIGPRDLYGLYASARRFVNRIAWDREAFRNVAPTLAYASPPTVPLAQDAVFEGGPTGFGVGALNRPHSVRVADAGVEGQATGIMHGKGNHANLHNPVTFETDLSRPTKLVVEVSGVSGYGGASLVVTLDGSTALSKDFPDPDGDRITDDLKQYVGDYVVEVPSGRHKIVVENTGQDWILAGFRFQGALVRKAPPLVSWASVGKTTALAWVRLEERTWRRVCAQKATIPPSPPSILSIPSVPPGAWRCELWDTWAGKPVSVDRIKVAGDGLARIPLPSIEKDLAVKLIRVGP